MDYIIAVQTPAYNLGQGRFAVDTVFARHLQGLKDELYNDVARIVLVAPQMSQAAYRAQKHHMAELCDSGSFVFVPSHEDTMSDLKFWAYALPSFLLQVQRMMPRALVVHSGMSFSIRRPILAWVNVITWLNRRQLLFVLDIDFRKDAKRYRKLGASSLAKYMLNVTILDPFRWVQLWAAPRMSRLVLLKGQDLVRDFGNCEPHVKYFHDTVHSLEDVLAGAALSDRLHWLQMPDEPLVLCYFGRLAWKKGVERMVEALGLLREEGINAQLKIIGDGESRGDIDRKIETLSLGSHVEVLKQVQYGPELFAILDKAHLSLAAPLVEDTPRSAFDALARALPIVAFDTEYFQDLAAASNAIALARWPEPAALAKMIAEVASDRRRLAQMATNGTQFAAANTQEVWLNRRAAWTRRFLTHKQTADLPSQAGNPRPTTGEIE